jgi:hypothetical protein
MIGFNVGRSTVAVSHKTLSSMHFIAHVKQPQTGVVAGGHQKIRTASRSTSARM